MRYVISVIIIQFLLFASQAKLESKTKELQLIADLYTVSIKELGSQLQELCRLLPSLKTLTTLGPLFSS